VWAPTFAVFWFRAAVKFYNDMLSFNSATYKQGSSLTPTSSFSFGLRHAGLWASCTPLRNCGATTHVYKPSCRDTLIITQISLLTCSVRLRMREVCWNWWITAEMSPRESDHKPETYHFWCASSLLLDLQADSRTRVWNRVSAFSDSTSESLFVPWPLNCKTLTIKL